MSLIKIGSFLFVIICPLITITSYHNNIRLPLAISSSGPVVPTLCRQLSVHMVSNMMVTMATITQAYE